MMRFSPTLLILILCGAGRLAGAEESGWIPLFNGKDLTGWRANVYPESFKVADGAIVGHSVKDRSHLFYVGDLKEGFVRFKDFELKAVVRGEPNSNSGIFFHTDFSVRDELNHLAKGYEVQLNNTPNEKRKTGSLYAVVDIDQSIVDESKWYEVTIRVEGKRIQVKIDGRTVVDYTQPANPERPPERKGRVLDPQGGAIALQAHDPGSVYHFKEVKIRRLN